MSHEKGCAWPGSPVDLSLPPASAWDLRLRERRVGYCCHGTERSVTTEARVVGVGAVTAALLTALAAVLGTVHDTVAPSSGHA
ncbi:hypothetical protein B5X24_HaOG210685, partial [Helicoverpa armigera]